MRIPWPHARRDLVILALTLVAWRIDASVRGGSVEWITATLAGTLTAICGYLFHEWGHLAGAVVSKSRVRLPERPSEIFLFNFDVDRNDSRQFTTMSSGGFLASAIAIVFLFLVLPVGALATTISLALVGLGIVATAVLELPPFFRVLRGGPMPRGVAYVSDDNRGDLGRRCGDSRPE
jgi:hypothetical protein